MMPKGVEHRGFAAQVLALCSTPFGIIGILTEGRRDELSEEFVLNAFRHHRNSHCAMYALTPRIKLCSTPFGIIGILTVLHHRFVLRRFLVLTAFRHNRNSHRVHREKLAPNKCAQRLSASSEFSLRFSACRD